MTAEASKVYDYYSGRKAGGRRSFSGSAYSFIRDAMRETRSREVKGKRQRADEQAHHEADTGQNRHANHRPPGRATR